MYDTCRKNDNLSLIITHNNFVNVIRFKDISHYEMFTLFCFSRGIKLSFGNSWFLSINGEIIENANIGK